MNSRQHRALAATVRIVDALKARGVDDPAVYEDLAMLHEAVAVGIPNDGGRSTHPPHPYRLRVAQRGWHGTQPATGPDDLDLGLMVPWVEIDGHRIDNALASVTVTAERDSFTSPTVTLELVSAVEWVYLDGDGNEIGSVLVDPEDAPQGEIRFDTFTPLVSATTDLDRIVAERERWRREAARFSTMVDDFIDRDRRAYETAAPATAAETELDAENPLVVPLGDRPADETPDPE